MKYEVTISRTCFKTYSVEAANVDLATDEATKQAYQDNWSNEEAEYYVEDTIEGDYNE